MSEKENAPINRVPTDPVLRARYLAIMAAGNYTVVGKAMGFTRGEAVRQWCQEGSDRHPSPEQARKLVEMCGNEFTLEQILPGVYQGLSVKELGYRPN